MRFHVFRVASGRGKGLRGTNAANSVGVLIFLSGSKAGHGDHLELYEVTTPQTDFGPYVRMRGRGPLSRKLGSLANDPRFNVEPPTSLIGRDYDPRTGSAWYSFPEDADFKAKFIGAIPLSEVWLNSEWKREVARAGGDVNAYMAWDSARQKQREARMDAYMGQDDINAVMQVGFPHQWADAKGRAWQVKQIKQAFNVPVHEGRGGIFTQIEKQRQRVPAEVLRDLGESQVQVGALSERDPGFMDKLKAAVRANPSVRPERDADRVAAAGHKAQSAAVRGEWRDSIGWLDAAVAAAADAADATSKRTGFGRREVERVLQAGDSMIDALHSFRMSLPEARRIVARAL